MMAEETHALIDALREMRAACAAGMYVMGVHGLADEFGEELERRGVRNGFGVRADKALGLDGDGD